MYDYKGRLMNSRVNAFYFPGLVASVSITASMFLEIAIVGQMLGSVAMGAVNLALPVTMVFNMVYMLFGTGAEVLVSAAKGAGNKMEANKLFSLAIVTILVISILLMLLGFGFETQLAAALCRGDAEIQPLLEQYIHMVFIAAPLMIAVTSMTYFVKVDALPKLAAGVMVFSNVVNLLSKVVYMGPLQTGIKGAAYGTLTGFAAGFLLLVPYLFFRRKRNLTFVSLTIKDFQRLGNIIVAGLPPSLGQGLGAVTAFCVNLVILDVAGKNGIIVNTVCSSLAIFVSSFRYAATSAMVPLVGALFGERDWWSMSQVALRITKMVMGFVAVSVLFVEIYPEKLLFFFGVHDQEVMVMGITALRIYAVSLFLGSINYLLMTYMQTTSRKVFSIAISAGNELLCVIFIYLLGYGFGEAGLWNHATAAYLTLLIAIVITSRYIGQKSKGKYRGIFIHEVRPDFVRGNSIFTTQEEATGYTDMIGNFFAENQVSQNVITDTKKLIYKAMMDIVEKAKNPAKTIDIMALVYNGTIRVRLRDDSGTLDQTNQQPDERLSRLSVMGYNNTYITVPI